MSETPEQQQPSSSGAGGPEPERHDEDAAAAPREAAAPQYPAAAPEDPAQAPQDPARAPQYPAQAPQDPAWAPQYPEQSTQSGDQPPQHPAAPQYSAAPQYPAAPQGQQPWQGPGAPMAQPGGAAAYGTRPQLSRGRRVLVVVAGVLAFLVAAALVRWGLSSFGGPSKQDLVDQGVAKITEQTTFPKQVDEITTWTGVDAEDEAIHYRYSVAADPTQISERAIRSSVLSNLCSTTATRDILEEDIAMRYSYVFPGSDKTVDLEFTDADC